MLSSKVIKAVLAAWPVVSRRRNDPVMLRSLPDPKVLSDLLQTAFLAGIEREEGESVSFRLVYLDDSASSQFFENWSDAVPFSDPVALSVSTLAKLSPALDQSRGALAISRNGSGQFQIRGAIFYGRRKTSLDGIETDPSACPRALTLSVRQPGSVIISYGDNIVGRFERGHFLIATPDPIFSTRLSRVFLEAIGQHELFERFGWAYQGLYLQSIRRIYQSASRHGHGSTLLWFPEVLRQRLLDRLEAGTFVSSTPDIARLMEQKLDCQQAEISERTGDGQAELQKHSERLSGLLASMGRLSCIDGALVFNEHLQIERFGCVLTVPPWDGRVVDGSTLDSGAREIGVSAYGTRHRSAIALVGALPGTLAIVISEDGPIRVMTRLKGENPVAVWPDCRDSIFLD